MALDERQVGLAGGLGHRVDQLLVRRLVAGHHAGRRSPEVVRLLIEHGAEIEWRDELGRTALIHAADFTWRKDEPWLESATAILKTLVDCGADVNAASGEGVTPLRELASHAVPLDAAALGLLLGAGAAVDARDWDGATPLMYAAQRGHHEVVQVLPLL